MKRLLALVLACVMVLSLAACGGSASSQPAAPVADGGSEGGDAPAISESYSWDVAMNVAESTLNYKMFAKFKELIEERSGGAITINLFPNGMLGGDAEQLQSLIDGTVAFSTTMTSGMTTTVPAYGMFDLPNVFPDVEAMRRVEANEDVLNALNEASAEKNIHLLGIADAGFRQLTANREITTIDGFSGLKIRVIDNPYYMGYWSALGAAPTPMDFNEVFTNLQQNVIDAQENPYMNIVGNNFHEVQDYLMETNHLGHVMVFTMNQALYSSLPDDVRALVDECANEALEYTRAQADTEIEGYKKTVEDSGTQIITLDASVLEAMQEAAKPVYDMVRQNIGDELVDTLLNAVN